MAIRLGVPKETARNERRVAATPESVKTLCAHGFAVQVERGAGEAAGFEDATYAQAGATVLERQDLWASAEVLIKVRAPSHEEAGTLAEGAVVLSLLQPERNPGLAERLAERRISALALERIPRITRAQKMDVLSSMANLAGYRAVIEAAEAYRGFFGPQMTAAGAMPPAKVLVIGAGVAGLAAIAAARSLGAEVRAFDTRAAAREQVESLGASFLTVALEEHGDGAGGYAKVMSPEFLAAELALFEAQAREVDVIITTALVPGAKAPLLLTKAVVEALKPGSVVVDLAAEQGGNCELTVADARVEHRGVRILGDTDLVSRMAPTASRFFANNLVHLLTEMGGGDAFRVDPDSELVRPALVTHGGEVLPPPPRPAPKSTPPVAPAAIAVSPPAPSPTVGPLPSQPANPLRRARQTAAAGAAALLLLLVVGSFAPRDFLEHLTVFVLACFVGWQVVWSVTPALHTPLMSVTNAISGIIIIGGMLQIGEGLDLASVLGALAVFFSAINIAGGFLVTQRMLVMFRRREPERGPVAASGAMESAGVAGGAR